MGGFVIAKVPLRAGLAALSPLPMDQAAREQVRAFAPDLIVSLTPARELAALGAGDWPDWLRGAGLDWVEFPIIDYGSAEALAGWPELSSRVHAVLDKGGRVLAHCRGGCGRSGMILLRLMVEAGEAPGAALARLRGIRPCAVETPEQLAWASQTTPQALRAAGPDGAMDHNRRNFSEA